MTYGIHIFDDVASTVRLVIDPIFAIVIAVVAILATKLPARTNIGIAGISSALGMGLLALASTHQALAIFLTASAV